jgi:hypothetical protein
MGTLKRILSRSRDNKIRSMLTRIDAAAGHTDLVYLNDILLL